MAVVMDQQTSFKHFCRICKKGFGCGRALGGHMRAHGIGDGQIEEEEHASDWEDKLGGNSPPGNKRMYALRTNPNRFKSCRICENCGKEFLSWKSFLEHGKCSSNDADSPSSSPGSDYDDEAGRRGCGWSKGKRSRRAKSNNCASSEEEDLANCLVMLSTARVDPLMVTEAEESCASASKEEERNNPVGVMAPDEKAKGVAKGMFECKACKKVFASHQALGGHRASHKKVKGCFAAKLDDPDESLVDEDVITNEEFLIQSKSASIMAMENGSNSSNPLCSPSRRKSNKVHECSICHRIFSSGQALGGHKRCHWVTTNSSTDTNSTSMAKFQQFEDQTQQIHQIAKFMSKSETIDLNLPAPVDDVSAVSRKDPRKQLNFDVSKDVQLESWIGIHMNGDDDNHLSHHHHHHQHLSDNNTTVINNQNMTGSMHSVDDEADSKVKLAGISDLKDMSLVGSSSPWLQVGIGSTTNGRSGVP